MVWEVGDSGSGRVRVRHRSLLVSVGQPYAFGGALYFTLSTRFYAQKSD